ncbi:MAG TPA: glycosyltransferase family 4 protein [Trichocoleus sp.]|jgi:glycosyltransferase involved in cell wall biosynthesis
MNTPWICCQIGAREHYAIPRSLHQAGQLAYLMTDAWVSPQSAFNALPNTLLRPLRDRFHPELADAPIRSFTASLLQFELMHRLQKTGDWERMIARNRWFQHQVIQSLKTIEAHRPFKTPPVLFTYSYAALDLLRYAKEKGWRTVLGQIDPGIVEEKIVLEEHQKHPTLAPSWQPVPPSYWATWQEECAMADQIVVNSSWSSRALQQAGIAADKIRIVPLAYTAPQESQGFERAYPDKFSVDRPLRVLFLGQIILRKGIAALLEAARLLVDQPIEFWLVGSIGIDRSQVLLPNIRWVGSVPRSETAQYYQQADVFLFPTLSDGFGLTQLESQAWKLPLIVSGFCGEVVKDRVNGIVLPEVTGEAIVTAIQTCLDSPEALKRFSQNIIPISQSSLSSLLQRLQQMKT